MRKWQACAIYRLSASTMMLIAPFRDLVLIKIASVDRLFVFFPFSFPSQFNQMSNDIVFCRVSSLVRLLLGYLLLIAIVMPY